MNKQDIAVGDIMQINPESHRGVDWFGACLFIVTEVKTWGAQGYVKNAGASGLAFIRVAWNDMEPTGGKAQWVQSDDDNPPS